MSTIGINLPSLVSYISDNGAQTGTSTPSLAQVLGEVSSTVAQSSTNVTLSDEAKAYLASLSNAVSDAGASANTLATKARGWFDQGKLLATGGVSQVEGAGGGGLGAWALISGYGSDHGVGVNAHYTTVLLPDYRLDTAGAAIGLFDRLELSYAWQGFDTRAVGAALGLGKGYTFHQNIFGAKLRLVGDAVYDQDRWLPQISVGLQHKENDRGAVIAAWSAAARSLPPSAASKSVIGTVRRAPSSITS